MEIAIIIGLIFLIIIFLFAQDSKQETKKERYGEAIGELASMVADSVSGMAIKLTEPDDKKNVRLAREKLAHRNGILYRFEHYSDEKYLKSQFYIDDYFKNALDTLELSEERWQKVAENLFYIGVLRKKSREIGDYSKKNTKDMRKHILYDWSNYDSKYLIKALNHFNIDKEDWIKYGDAVVEMYNLMDLPDLSEFGIIMAIKPMKNNIHLL